MNNEHEIIYNNNDDVDITVGLIPKTRKLSFRTRKDDVNVGRLAKRIFSGGGHKKSAGSGKLETEVFLQWLQKYYDLLDEKESESKNERKNDGKNESKIEGKNESIIEGKNERKIYGKNESKHEGKNQSRIEKKKGKNCF